MWDLLTTYFERYPAQARVARTMLRYGLRVGPEGVYCGDILLPDTAIARACDVDRRIVATTAATIRENPDLLAFYSHLEPTVHLKDAAPPMGWGVIEIVPMDAHSPGILAHVADVIAKRGISIRQAIVDDPELVEEPRLYVVTEEPIPMDAIGPIKAGEGVKSVVIS